MVPEVGLETPPGIEKMQLVDFVIGTILRFRTFEGKLVQNRGQGDRCASAWCLKGRMRSNWFSRNLIGCVTVYGAFVQLAHAQDGSIAFNPRETGELTLNWQTVAVGLLFSLGCYGLWRLLIWFLETRRARIEWRRVQYWWPTAMVLWGWIVVALFARNESSSWLFNAHFWVFSVVNFPVLLLVAAVLEVLHQPSSWQRLLVGSIAMWVGWHLLVRLAEWRAWINAPISLNLAENNTEPTHTS